MATDADVEPAPALEHALASIPSRLRDLGYDARYARPESAVAFYTQAPDNWSCGYRGLQMLCSGLRACGDEYETALSGGRLVFSGGRVASVRGVQAAIVAALDLGFYPKALIDGRGLVGSTSFITAGHAVSALRQCGLRARAWWVGRRYRDVGPLVAAKVLVAKLKQYFCDDDGRDAWPAGGPLPPVMVGFNGHERVIVGVARKDGIDHLVLLDPYFDFPTLVLASASALRDQCATGIFTCVLVAPGVRSVESLPRSPGARAR